MASQFGQLSPEQVRFRDELVARTGLSGDVVTAWIAAESGWNTSKPSHNYLNVGPGRRYASPERAAASVAGIIGSDPRYAGVDRSATKGPFTQVAAIVASPWDAGHYAKDGQVGRKLTDVYDQLTGNTPKTGFWDNLTIDLNPFDDVLPEPNLVPGNLGGTLLSTDRWLSLGVTLLLGLGAIALALIALYQLARPHVDTAVATAVGAAS